MKNEIKSMYKITLTREEVVALVMNNAEIPEDLYPLLDNSIVAGIDMLDDGDLVLRLEIVEGEE